MLHGMEQFRLVRIGSGDALDDLAFLTALSNDGSPSFSLDRSSAMLMNWPDFVRAASAVWLSLGPVDIFPDRVFVLPTGGIV